MGTDTTRSQDTHPNSPPTPPNTCNRCGYFFPHLAMMPPEVGRSMLDDHLKLCSDRLDAPQIEATRATSTASEGDATKAGPAKKARTRRKYIMDPMARKAILENDKWSGTVTETSIYCKGCEKVVCLDSRSKYFLGLWEKHRARCRGIRRLEERDILKKEQNEVKMSSKEINDVEDIPTVTGEGTRSESAEAAPTESSEGSWTVHSVKSRNNGEPGMSHERWSAEPVVEATRAFHPNYEMVDSPSAERAGSYPHDEDYYFNREYWEEPVFATTEAVDDSPGPTDRLYRYSTRWELTTNFRDTPGSGYKRMWVT